MGRRQHEALETDALLARKDEQISALDARLHQTITHLSLVRARLLSTLDQLDSLQQEHAAALATAAREQQRLGVKLRASEEMARAGEADRMDMRDAVAMLVKRVEATPEFRNGPRSQIQLTSLSEPSRHSSTHQEALVSPFNPHRHKHSLSSSTNPEAGRPTSSAKQLAYASTLISHFRSERDTAILRTEQCGTWVLEFESRLARREATLAACSCAALETVTTGTGLAGASQIHLKRDEQALFMHYFASVIYIGFTTCLPFQYVASAYVASRIAMPANALYDHASRGAHPLLIFSPAPPHVLVPAS